MLFRWGKEDGLANGGNAVVEQQPDPLRTGEKERVGARDSREL